MRMTNPLLFKSMIVNVFLFGLLACSDKPQSKDQAPSETGQSAEKAAQAESMDAGKAAPTEGAGMTSEGSGADAGKSGQALGASGGDKEKMGEFFGAKPTEYPDWFKTSFLDFPEDIDEAKAGGKRLMVFFHQDGCPYCNALVERNLSQKDIEDMMRDNFDAVAINMWGDREVTYVDGKQYTEKKLAEHLKVQFTPTLLFYDEQGNVVLRLNGYRPPNRFKVDLAYVAEKVEKEKSYREFVKAKYNPGASKKEMISEPFFQSPPYDLTRKSGKPLAVFFEQKDCPNCELMHGKILPDEELRKVLKDFDVVQLDMWSKTEITTPGGEKTTARKWAEQLDVKYAPSIVVFNTKGEEVIRSEAFFKVFHTRNILRYVLDEAYKKEPSFQRYLSERADHLREQGKDVDIWRYADEDVGERKQDPIIQQTEL